MANGTICQDPYSFIPHPAIARQKKFTREFIEPVFTQDVFVNGIAYGDYPSDSLLRFNLYQRQTCTFSRTAERVINSRFLIERGDVAELVRDIMFHAGLKPQDLITGHTMIAGQKVGKV